MASVQSLAKSCGKKRGSRHRTDRLAKALGVPPGLALLVASSRAMTAWRKRNRKPSSLYLDFAEWLPVMEAYEARKPYYFATPPVNLIMALDVSLSQILAEGMEQRFARHAQLAGAFRAAFRAMELDLLPLRDAVTANTLGAVYCRKSTRHFRRRWLRRNRRQPAGGLHRRSGRSTSASGIWARSPLPTCWRRS
jgi:alanine-glyoxylate transaminase/serine-glyoxylate transaminase/serine-pyruvate transaminase